MVSFNVSKHDHELIALIVRRAIRDAAPGSLEPAGKRISTRQELTMDLTAVHANGMPLDLEGLLAADTFDFNHDVYGIRRFLDRTTGTLGGCFVPRYARKRE